MWDLPRPGLEPVSPALAGRLSTTAPPGKPPFIVDVIYFKLLLLVINNNLLTMIKNSKRRKNRGRNHEEMGLEREEKKFASGTFQIMNIVF